MAHIGTDMECHASHALRVIVSPTTVLRDRSMVAQSCARGEATGAVAVGSLATHTDATLGHKYLRPGKLLPTYACAQSLPCIPFPMATGRSILSNESSVQLVCG